MFQSGTLSVFLFVFGPIEIHDVKNRNDFFFLLILTTKLPLSPRHQQAACLCYDVLTLVSQNSELASSQGV